MSNLDTINVGGINYDIEDATARPNAASALTITAYKEDGNTASRSYSVVGTPINWKGTLYYTSATIAAGATLAVGTNLVAATNIGQYLLTRTNRIRTYVGSDSKLHFTDATGADSVLPFNSGDIAIYAVTYYVNSSSEVVAVYLTNNTIQYTSSPPYSDSYVTLNPHGQDYGYWSVTAKVGMTYSYGVGRGGFGQYAAYKAHANANQTIVNNWCRTAVFVIHSLD